ncbi:phage tail protein [Bacillus sp. FSL W7-1360]
MKTVVITNFQQTYAEILTDFDPASFTEEWSLNNQWQIQFSVIKTPKNAFAFDLISHESTMSFNEQIFVIKQMTTKAIGGTIQKDVTALHIYFTMQDVFKHETRSGKLSISACLSHLLDANDSGFTWGTVGEFTSVEQENFGAKNLLDGCMEVMKDYDAVMVADNKHLTFYARDQYGAKTGKYIRYRYNTDDMQAQVDTTQLKTRIKGFGKQKENGSYYFAPVTYTSEQAKKWGIREATPITDERMTNQASMSAKLARELQDYPTISLSTSLKRDQPVKKGEYWVIVYEPMGLKIDTQLVGYKQYPFTSTPPEITLSNEKATILDIQVQLAKDIKRWRGAKP